MRIARVLAKAANLVTLSIFATADSTEGLCQAGCHGKPPSGCSGHCIGFGEFCQALKRSDGVPYCGCAASH